MSKAPILIHWYGPYSIDAICNKSFGGEGLYLFTGMAKYKRELGIPYCGIAENWFCNYFKTHSKIDNITRKLNVWLGYIAYPKNFTRNHLEHAESIIIYYMQPDLNIRKKANPPDSVILISHWFKPNETPRINQLHPIRNLPDVICWDGEYWRTSNLRVIHQ